MSLGFQGASENSGDDDTTDIPIPCIAIGKKTSVALVYRGLSSMGSQLHRNGDNYWYMIGLIIVSF